MIGRLFLGIFKGLLIGGLIGFGIAKLGFVAPGAFVAYLAAAVTGVMVGLIAGKPIWAKDAKIEAGMKAFFGALVAAGLMYVVRRWVTMPVPIPLGDLAQPNEYLSQDAATLGGLAITSLPMIAVVLGAFYDVDNTDDGASAEAKPKVRIAADATKQAADEDDEAAAEEEPRRAKK